MQKLITLLAIAGIFAIVLTGCTKKDDASNKIDTSKTTAETEITDIDRTESAIHQANSENDRWEKLWPGKDMEVNLNAKNEVIGSFVSDGNMMYIATNYNDLEEKEKLYCYYFGSFFEKEDNFYEKMEYPTDLAAVAEDIRSNSKNFWNYNLGYQTAAGLNSSNIEVEIAKQEIVTLNGREFLREIAYAESVNITYTKSTRFVAYYYQTDEGQGVCVFGDCSAEQNKFEKIEEVAEAIMSTYREDPQ